MVILFVYRRGQWFYLLKIIIVWLLTSLPLIYTGSQLKTMVFAYCTQVVSNISCCWEVLQQKTRCVAVELFFIFIDCLVVYCN